MIKKLDEPTKRHLRHITRLLASFRGNVPVSEQSRATENVMAAVEKIGSPYEAVSDAFAATGPATAELNSRLDRDFKVAAELLTATFARIFGTAPQASPVPSTPPKKPTLISSFKAGFNLRSQPKQTVADIAAGNIPNPHSSMGIRHRLAESMGKASAWVIYPGAMATRRDLKRAVRNLS
jgi:hypothetical protein